MTPMQEEQLVKALADLARAVDSISRSLATLAKWAENRWNP